MGSYNRKQCAIPGCGTFIYDGHNVCQEHNHVQAEFFSDTDMPLGFVDQFYGATMITFTSGTDSVIMQTQELERVLAELGWTVTRPGMQP